ncbi:MAG: tetratricopeptide repeat protein [Asgard group archaeon]|nr:tetratricopeptide repeat protein [Asgard group archaeon]
MVLSKSKEIIKIEDLIFKGQYREATDTSDKIISNKKSSKEDRILALINKGRSIFMLGILELNDELYNEVLNCYEDAVQESKDQESLAIKMDAYFGLILIYLYLKKYEECLQAFDKIEHLLDLHKEVNESELKLANAIMYFLRSIKHNVYLNTGRDVPKDFLEKGMKNMKKSLKLYKEISYKFEAFICEINIANLHYAKGNYKEAIKQYEIALKIAEDAENKYYQSLMLVQIVDVYWRMGDLEKLPIYINQFSKIDEEIGNKRTFGRNQNWFGIYYAEKGDLDKALEHFEKALDNWEKNNQKDWIATGNNNIGAVYGLKGDINKALECYLEAYKIRQDQNIQGPTIEASNVAYMYYLKGELDKAYNLFKKELTTSEKYKNNRLIMLNLHLISNVYWQQGKAKEAIQTCKRNLKIREKLGNKLEIGYTLKQLINYYAELNQQEQAKKYLENFKAIIDEVDNKPLLLDYRISEALTLKISNQQRDRIKAEVLFDQLLEGKLIYQNHVAVLLNLSELLLNELQNTNDETILKKIKKHVNRIYGYAISNNSYLLTVEALWLQSQIAMIELNIKEARSKLQKAQEIINEKGLERLVTRIAIENEKLEKLSFELIEAGKKSYSISKRMEIINVQNTVKEIRKKRLIEDTLEDISSSRKIFSIKI